MKAVVIRNSALVLLFIFSFSHTPEAFSQSNRKLLFQGNEAYMSENYEEAIDYYNEAFALDSSDYRSVFNSANAHFRNEETEEAIGIWQSVIHNTENKVEKARAYHNIGNAHLISGELDKAIEAYKDALRNNPRDHETRYNLAFAQQLKDEQDDQDNEDQDDQDQEQDEDQDDQEQDEDGENDEDQEGEGDEENDEQDQEQENQQDDDQNGDDEEQQQAQPQQLSQEDMERLLDALERDEKDIQQRLREQRGKTQQGDIEKDW